MKGKIKFLAYLAAVLVLGIVLGVLHNRFTPPPYDTSKLEHARPLNELSTSAEALPSR